ncbi:MAG: HEAT repeat domain-containing protein [Myxococcales bacterium]|nr:HEAT repeat domain-containing protein [Myxococcales bacterium]
MTLRDTVGGLAAVALIAGLCAAGCYGKEGAVEPETAPPAPSPSVVDSAAEPVAPPVDEPAADDGARDLSAERFARVGALLDEDLSELASPDPDTRADAVDLLDVDEPEVLAILEDFALGDADPRVRVRAVEQLGFSEAGRAQTALRRALDDASPDVVAAAAVELGARGDPADIRYLEPLREHPSPTVREEAGFAIELLTE